MTDQRNSTPTCPSCGYALMTDDMLGRVNTECSDLFALAPAEGRTAIDCPVCGVTYHCQGGYEPFYVTALDEDDL